MSGETKVEKSVKDTEDLLQVFKKDSTKTATLLIKKARVQHIAKTDNLLLSEREVGRAWNIKQDQAIGIPSSVLKQAYFTKSMTLKLAELQK